MRLKNFIADMRIAFLFVGTIIGAGFASGRELVSFFGDLGVYLIPVGLAVGGMFFYTCWLFLKLGKLIKPDSLADITKRLYGRGAAAMDVFIIISYFIVVSAMLAGVESLVRDGFGIDLGFPLFSVLTMIVSLLIVVRGIDGVISANSVLVPLIVVFTLGVSVSGLIAGGDGAAIRTSAPADVLSLVSNCILYVCMNMLLTAAVLGGAGRNLSNRTIIAGSSVGSAIIAVSVSVILAAIFAAGGGVMSADMPILEIASGFGGLLAVVAALIIWFGVCTTLISSVYPIVEWSDNFIKRRSVSLPIIAAVAIGVSLIGFSAVVDFLYPLMGAIGLFFIISASIYYFKNRKRLDFSE